MSRHASCTTIALAEGPIVRIELCRSCDVMSLHLGATTVRLDAAAAESLWTTLGRALAAAAAGDAAQPPAPARVHFRPS